MPHPWDRRPKESVAAYRAFLVYRDQGLDRSLTAVKAVYAQRPTKESGARRPDLERWSSRYQWVERCRAWDNHVQAEKDKVALAEARKWELRRQ
jgi:hypothetical protein